MLVQVIIFKLMNTMYSLKSLKASANPCQYIEEVRAYISHVGERIFSNVWCNVAMSVDEKLMDLSIDRVILS